MYIDEYGIQYSDDKKTLIKVPEDYEGEIVIMEGVTDIAPNAFTGCSRAFLGSIPESLRHPDENASGFGKAIQKVLDFQAGKLDENDLMGDVEFDMEDSIEGEGCERHLTYYLYDQLYCVDIVVLDDELYMHRDVVTPDDGYVDIIHVYDIEKIMQVLGVHERDSIIDALMQRCKSDECLFDMDVFDDWLRANRLLITREPIGKYEPFFDEEGNLNSRFIPEK